MLRLLALTSWKHIPWVAAALAFALSLASVLSGYFLDDKFHNLVLSGIAMPGGPRGFWDLYRFVDSPEGVRAQVQAGAFPWWTSEELHLAFFRPIPSALRAAEFALFRAYPAVGHVLSSLWLSALVASVYALYQSLFQRRAREGLSAGCAGLGAVLFAIDDAHNLNVAWVAARYSLIAGTFAVMAIVSHVRARESAGSALLSPFFLTLALLSGESSLGALGYLFAYAWIVDDAGRLRGLLRLIPHALIVGGWAAAYKALGYGAAGSSFYIDPLASPDRFAIAIVTRLPKLALAQLFLPPAEIFSSLDPKLEIPVVILTLALAALLYGGLVRLAHSRLASALLLGSLLAALPQCATVADDRLLLLPGVGVMGAVAVALSRLAEERPATRLRVLSGVLLTVHLVLAPVLFPIRQRVFPDFLQGLVRRGGESLSALTIQDKPRLVLGCPDALICAYMTIEGIETRGAEEPRSFILSVQTKHRFEILRTSDQTFEIHNDSGFNDGPFGGLYREGPYNVGDRYEGELFDVEVTEVKNAHPTRTKVTLKRPYDDFQMLVWQASGMVELPNLTIDGVAAFDAISLPDAMSQR